MKKSPIDVIAGKLPTYADCYKNPVEITVPSTHRITKDAGDIMAALAAEGFYIVRMDGGLHQGACPTCGCNPAEQYAD